MFITPQELKVEVRNLRSEITAVAKDLGGEVQTLYYRIQQIQETLEEILNKLNDKR